MFLLPFYSSLSLSRCVCLCVCVGGTTMNSKLLTAAILLVIAFQIAIINRQGGNNISDAIVNSESKLGLIPVIDGAYGPESLAFDPQGGGPYTGVSGGRIIKWDANQRRWTDYAFVYPDREKCDSPRDHVEIEHVCGRPLGLCFNKLTGELAVADPYLGLLNVKRGGGLARILATHVGGIPFGFTNSLDIDSQSGLIYFTDSSSRYQRRNYVSLILGGDESGRLMKYNPESNQTTLLLNNLMFPNGVSLSPNGDFLLISETTNCRILRYWLKTEKKGTVDVFAHLPGFPDNIKRSPRGGYWVGIYTKKEKLIRLIISYPWMGSFLLKLPVDIMKVHAVYAQWRGKGMAVRLNEDGDLVEVLDEEVGRKFKSISEVEERDWNLWIGSVNAPFLGVYDIKSTNRSS